MRPSGPWHQFWDDAINSDLAPGDEVVLYGAYELKLASEQRGVTAKGGHFHADGTFHGDH